MGLDITENNLIDFAPDLPRKVKEAEGLLRSRSKGEWRSYRDDVVKICRGNVFVTFKGKKEGRGNIERNRGCRQTTN
jgi:hypothetical protein